MTSLHKRLERLDQASSAGVWTGDFLRIIEKNPGVRAAELAVAIGWETDKLKLFLNLSPTSDILECKTAFCSPICYTLLTFDATVQ